LIVLLEVLVIEVYDVALLLLGGHIRRCTHCVSQSVPCLPL